MERLVEICCGSYEDALNAYYGRAKRIELNSALHLGGLTPSIASLKLTKKNTNLKIITMIRPRDRKSTRLNSSHKVQSRMPSSA